MQQRGQGSLEYLLIIGGGILVAVVIIGAIVSLAGTGSGGTKANIANQTCHTYLAQAACESASNASLGIKSVDAACTTGGKGSTACCFDDTQNTGLKCFVNPKVTYN